MLSDASGCFGQVIISVVCGSIYALLSELGLTETIKMRDVLLPLGRKQRCDFLMLFTLLTLCTFLIAMISCLHLILLGDMLDSDPGVDY